MRTVLSIAAAVALAVAVAGPASAAPGDTYKAKKAECQARAKTMDLRHASDQEEPLGERLHRRPACGVTTGAGHPA